jgi:hypothetical protein
MAGSVEYREIKIDIKAQCLAVLEAAGQYCEQQVKEKSPVRTGNYKNSWTHKLDKDAMQVTIYNTSDEAEGKLPIFIEFGHYIKKTKKYIAPYEHIRPAYNLTKEKFKEDLEKVKFVVE